MSISSQINGSLRELIGPDGTDILKNPLKIRMNIITAQEQKVEDLVTASGTPRGPISKFVLPASQDPKILQQAGIQNAKNLEIIRLQRDAQWQTNQLAIDDLEKKKSLAKTDAERKKDRRSNSNCQTKAKISRC